MFFDAAVIALSLAALAYVGRSLMRPREALVEATEEIHGPTDEAPREGFILGRLHGILRGMLSARSRQDMAHDPLPADGPDLGTAQPPYTPEMYTPETPLKRAAAAREEAAAEAAPQAIPPAEDTVASALLDVLIDIDGQSGPEVEVVDLSDPEDVLALEFAEDPTGHLHLLHGRAEARMEDGIARSRWLDIYLSRSGWLDRLDLDQSGEFPPSLARHVLRIDLGSTLTAPDGTVTGAINEDPDLYFDREVSSEIDFTV